jgi:hypothetical protein
MTSIYPWYGLGRTPSVIASYDHSATRVIDVLDPGWGITKTPLLYTVTAVLNQGNTPHCVGFDGADFGNTLPVNDGYTNADANALYYECKQLDREPRQENGSSIHTLAKVLKARGRIGDFSYGTTLDTVLRWLSNVGPVPVGTDWFEGMFDATKNGLVKVSGALAGGHAYLMIGYNPLTRLVTFLNSWGDQWARGGIFDMNVNEWWQVFTSNGEALLARELPLAPKKRTWLDQLQDLLAVFAPHWSAS